MRDCTLDLLFRACHSGRSYDGHERHRKKRWYDAEKARVLEQRPKKLPRKRRNISQTSLTLHPQHRSPLFLKLPLEIRRRIYEYALGGEIIHLTHISKRIVHQRFRLPESTYNDAGGRGGLGMREPPEIEWISYRHRIPEPGQFSESHLPLLKTCHAVYAEAIDILYNKNIYSMSSPLVSLYLRDYALRPQRLAQMKHLRLYWRYFSDPADSRECIHEPYDIPTWNRFWVMVAGMRLRTLGVWILYDDLKRVSDCSIEDSWVRPMLLVSGLERVELQIEYWVAGRERRTMEALEKAITRTWLGSQTA